MDLKQYAGKTVLVQLKHPWLVAVAPTTEGTAPQLSLHPEHDQPTAMPIVYGDVDEHGRLIILTGGGGRISIEFNADVVHSICDVLDLATEEAETDQERPKEPSRIIRPNMEGITPGGT